MKKVTTRIPNEHVSWPLELCAITMGLIVCIIIIIIQTQNASANWLANEPYSIDSPHNYQNNYFHEWIIDRPNAFQMKVRFNTIDTENGFDFIWVKDGLGNIYNTYSGQQNFVTSNWVPGSRIRIQFQSDNLVRDWGFFLDFLYSEYNTNIESSHNYLNNCDDNWYLEMKYASKISIKFEKIEVETNYDYIRIYDYKGNLKWTYTGFGTNVWSPSIVGPKVRIRLTSDQSNVYYGFKISQITTSIDDDSRYEISVLGVADYKAQPHLNNYDAILCKERFENGYLITQNLYDASVDDHSFFTQGDSGDIIYFTGHGGIGYAMLDGYNQWWKYAKEDRYFDHVDAFTSAMGDDDWEWTVFACCWVCKDKQSHLKEFLMHKGHGVYGYRDVSLEGLVDQNSADNAILIDFYDNIRAGMEIEFAWARANHDNQQFKVAAAMHDTNDDDHFWGFGTVYPDCTDNNDISKWHYD